jgi:DNA-binding LacI/PurR family transcriptional regulator
MISAQARKLLAKRFSENVVMISRFYLEDGISGVGISDYSSGMFAVEELLKRGHTNIGWIGSLGSEDISRMRYYGVISGLQKYGVKLISELWMNERKPLEQDDVGSAMTAALSPERQQWPTAWVASNDWLGAKGMLWLECQGLRCPSDFSLICFDDTKIAETLAQRKLTSVISPAVKVAEGAVKLLVDRWNGKIIEPTGWLYPVSYREGTTLAEIKNEKAFHKEAMHANKI